MSDPATSEGRTVGAVVLGVPDSGESAVAAILGRSGFLVPGTPEPRRSSGSDPRHYGEKSRIHRVNDRVLRALGGDRMEPPPRARQLAARQWAIPTLRAELQSLLRYSGDRPVVLEDPRIGMMLPLWGELLASRFDPVLVVREPAEIAAALVDRGTGSAAALAAWEVHMRGLAAHLAGSSVIVVPYAQLVDDPALGPVVVAALRARLEPRCSAMVEPGHAAGAVAPELRPSRSGARTGPNVLTHVRAELWRWLEALPAGRQRLHPPAALLRDPGSPSSATRSGRRTAAETRPADVGSERRPPMPVVVGAPRSGTTMLRLMFDAHPELTIPPETRFIPALWTVWQRTHDPAQVLVALARHRQWPFFDLDIGAVAARIEAEVAPDLSSILRAFYSLFAERRGTVRWGDKSPVYALHLPLVASILPEAHFIHLIRDGRDAALSVLRLWFGPSTIEEAARWWVDHVATARAQAARVRYTEVRYEDLVFQPRAELMRLCRFIALPFDQRMLAHQTGIDDHQRELELLRRTYLSQEGAGLATESQLSSLIGRLAAAPDPDRIGAWRAGMSCDDRRRFEAVAGGLLEELGYPLT